MSLTSFWTVESKTNHQGNAAPPKDLSAWLPKEKYDIYFVGFQVQNTTLLMNQILTITNTIGIGVAQGIQSASIEILEPTYSF